MSWRRRLMGCALIGLAALAAFAAGSWWVSVKRFQQHRARLEFLLNVNEHESAPMPRGHLDRG